MIEVFKIIHNYYDTRASVKSNFDPVCSTRGNKFKLRKDVSLASVKSRLVLPFSYRPTRVVLEKGPLNSVCVFCLPPD